MSNHARPFVSVITPTYNRREFLPMLIHLYQSQTYPKELRELVILDDSPTTNEDLIPKNDKSIQYYYQSEKMTLGEKRNKLNELAKGDVIVCFDDDDYHFPERITQSILKLNSTKSLIAGCSTLSIYYTDINETYKYGPFGNNHGTNGTFAYRREYIATNKHDPTLNAQEEPSFTNNFTNKMAQLETTRTIICISHTTNTYDKRKLLNQKKEKVGQKINKLIKDKKYLDFLNNVIKPKYTQNQEINQEISNIKLD
jgi:glycosyltransferase involved in cell wall biosynthesis